MKSRYTQFQLLESLKANYILQSLLTICLLLGTALQKFVHSNRGTNLIPLDQTQSANENLEEEVQELRKLFIKNNITLIQNMLCLGTLLKSMNKRLDGSDSDRRAVGERFTHG